MLPKVLRNSAACHLSSRERGTRTAKTLGMHNRALPAERRKGVAGDVWQAGDRLSLDKRAYRRSGTGQMYGMPNMLGISVLR
jgi:hypothetical protein